MQLLRSTAVVSGMTLISRISGFLRDMVLARTFGVSAATDAFYVALRIPNLMRRLFAEGSFSLAFVPVFSAYKEQGDRLRLRRMLDAVAGSLLAVLLVVVGIGLLAAPAFVALFAPGFVAEPDKFGLATHMLRITFPYALLISLVALAGAILNSFGRFAVPAFTPVLLNIGLIAAAVFLAPHMAAPIVALAWGVLGAGVVQLLFQIPALVRIGLLPRFRWHFKHPGVKKIGRLMLPTLFGSSVAQINLLIDTLIASLLITGSISWLFYSDRLLEFPLGVFGIALSTVILPVLSRYHVQGETEEFGRAVDWGLRMGALIALPAAVGLAILAGPVVATLFQHGEFSSVDVSMTAISVVGYAIGLPAYVGIKVLAPAYYARQDTRTPVRAAVIAMTMNMVLNVVFVGLLVRWPVLPAHLGLAVSSSVAAYLNAGLLYRRLRQTHVDIDAWTWHRYLPAMAIASAIMGSAVGWLVWAWWEWSVAAVMERVLGLASCIALGAACYAGVLLLAGLRPAQFRWNASR